MILLLFVQKSEAKELLSPCPVKGCGFETVKTNERVGLASYYSRKGCLGCSKNFTMANGKKLDDAKLTVAYNIGKLNRKIRITSVRTKKTVIATVTDRGGFERHGKIIDLSVATKQALGCENVCKVKIEEL